MWSRERCFKKSWDYKRRVDNRATTRVPTPHITTPAPTGTMGVRKGIFADDNAVADHDEAGVPAWGDGADGQGAAPGDGEGRYAVTGPFARWQAEEAVNAPAG